MNLFFLFGSVLFNVPDNLCSPIKPLVVLLNHLLATDSDSGYKNISPLGPTEDKSQGCKSDSDGVGKTIEKDSNLRP